MPSRDVADGATLVRNPAGRLSFVRQGEGAMLLFVDGECFECAGERVEVDSTMPTWDSSRTLIVTLPNQGSLGFEG